MSFPVASCACSFEEFVIVKCLSFPTGVRGAQF